MPSITKRLNGATNLALVSAIYLALCASSVFATNDYQTPEGWRTECLGRSQFDMPPHTVWHLRMPFDNSVSYVTDDPWFGRYMDYGTEPVSGVYKLVRIRISPETTRAAFDNAVGVEMPNKTKAQMRVLRNRVNERRERFDPEKDDREQYIEDLMNLDAENERYSDMISDITRFKIFIDFDKSKGRPTEELEAQLADYERQIAALPTDERYEHERAFDLGIPDAAGAWHPDKMVALLWRNNRIYHFEFGPKNGPRPVSALSPARRIRDTAGAGRLSAFWIHCRQRLRKIRCLLLVAFRRHTLCAEQSKAQQFSWGRARAFAYAHQTFNGQSFSKCIEYHGPWAASDRYRQYAWYLRGPSIPSHQPRERPAHVPYSICVECRRCGWQVHADAVVQTTNLRQRPTTATHRASRRRRTQHDEKLPAVAWHAGFV